MHQGRQRSRLCAAAILVALALGGLVEATHRPDHRFIVLGFVTDSAGRPLADIPVVVTRLKTGLQYPTRTERDGFYLVVVHLHNEDEGESLVVSANGVTGETRARFDIRETRVERGTRVDIRGREVVVDRRAFAKTLHDYLTR